MRWGSYYFLGHSWYSLLSFMIVGMINDITNNQR